MAIGDRLEVRVRVRVAVDVAELDEAAQALGPAHLHDPAVLDGDHGGAGARVDVDAAAGLAGLDGHRRVAPAGDALVRLALGQVVGVARPGVHGEHALRQAGERADEVGRQAADQAGAHQDRVDVPVGVVVGEDGLADVLHAAGGLEVAGGGEDRVDRVVRVLLLSPLASTPYCFQVAGMNCIQPSAPALETLRLRP
jgi:hypothetical protein